MGGVSPPCREPRQVSCQKSEKDEQHVRIVGGQHWQSRTWGNIPGVSYCRGSGSAVLECCIRFFSSGTLAYVGAGGIGWA